MMIYCHFKKRQSFIYLYIHLRISGSSEMSKLFTPLKLRSIELKNRIAVPPMCQYSAIDGFPNDWHSVHYGSRAVGGASLIIFEATAVTPIGRISPSDLGIWDDEHIGSYKKITSFVKQQGSVPGIQLAHAGRKASTKVPWEGNGSVSAADGGWETIAPSAIRFSPEYAMPREMTSQDIAEVPAQFETAARRSLEAGFELLQLHMAHGYLIHQFLSPLSNKRIDNYGGSLENRCRLGLEIAERVRKAVPDHLPLCVRFSATDWVEGGWDIKQAIQFAKWLKERGVDLIDCSTGGNISDAVIPVGPGYQVRFAELIKKESGVLTGTVGLITSPEQAEQILLAEQADVVFLGRQLLRDPYWPLHAAKRLRTDVQWPKQYLRAK
jgi:2,4-dienoyl-CoA reductase-like NADH-dependent reductase (Old Yellow Enzyme family)